MSLIEQIALTKIKGVGAKNARLLLAYCGSPEEIFRASKKSIQKIPGIGPYISENILQKEALNEAEKELEFIEKNAIQTLWIEDSVYPKKLKSCEDAPLLLYFKGNTDFNNKRIISIVGTRNATSYGRVLCDELINGLAELDPVIISGLAYGIDIYAHKQALKYQIPTVGVLGHGLDRIYPSAHRETALKMIHQGGLLTEFPHGTNPDRSNFPMRNRIIAGLADVTIVVEAAKKGGALITAEIANSYNRDVCAFPGAVHQTYSEGCNYLIKTNRAHLIQNSADLKYLMNWYLPTHPVKNKQLNLIPPDLSKDEQQLYDFLSGKEHAHIDEIALFCDWPQSKLAIILLEMEMKNVIVALPGKVFKIL